MDSPTATFIFSPDLVGHLVGTREGDGKAPERGETPLPVGYWGFPTGYRGVPEKGGRCLRNFVIPSHPSASKVIYPAIDASRFAVAEADFVQKICLVNARRKTAPAPGLSTLKIPQELVDFQGLSGNPPEGLRMTKGQPATICGRPDCRLG